MKYFALVLMVMGTLSMTACQTLQNSGTKETIGGASGAVIGGILGSKVGKGNGQLWATGVGVLVGGLLGSNIGRSLDRADMMYANRANQQAHTVPLGETISWNNPESGNHGSVTPRQDGYSSAGRYCREYEQSIFVAGREQTAVGTACQNTDGTWEIVS